jgi:HD-GYP domain-containing protein (c-di-GMP phosphodiesterase class II)
VKPVANETIMNIIRYHHTRYDGNSQGQNQPGTQISIFVRIVNLADSLDAMISDRPYRKECPIEDDLKKLKRCAGTQFDIGRKVYQNSDC